MSAFPLADLGFQGTLQKKIATMKWATLICLLIFTIATESRHLQKRHHEQHPRLINNIVTAVGKPVVEKLVLVMLAQDFEKCSLDEHLKLHEKIMEAVDNCEKHPEEAICKKPAMELYHEIVCKEEDIDQIYPWTKDCCGKEEAERIKCFFEHREYKVEEYKIPNIEESCKAHEEHPQRAFFYYLSNIAKRHPKLYQPAVIGFAIQYNQITTECCAAEDKAKCFSERMPQVKKLTNYLEDKQKQKCRIIKEFPEIVFKGLTLVQVSQKFGKAAFEDVKKVTEEIVHLNQDCCKGDAVECMIERLEATDHICEAKDKLSTKLADCCAKNVLERTPCILALPNDESDLSKELKKYYEDEHVCDDYNKDKLTYLAHFTHDYSRSHQESSPQSCLRVAKGFEGFLEKCCASENRVECLKKAPILLEAALKENEELKKQNCDALKALGIKDFHIQLLVRYFLKMPQVTSPTLVDLTGRMTKIGVYCCGVAEDKQQTCAEEKLDILLGEMCEKEKETFVNDNVHHCCINSYADRRKCFTNLQPYAKYVAPAWDESALHFDADLCKGSEEDQIRKKLELFVEYMKMKPGTGQEKVKEITETFRKSTLKCCTAEDQQQCFKDEKAGLLEIILAH
ncbi:albumin-like [Lithobates pipiens]